ncbi:MAG: hypothetical protein ACK5IQ_06575 [Bacteroidales bacterium]
MKIKLFSLAILFLFASCNNDDNSNVNRLDVKLDGFNIEVPYDTVNASNFYIEINYLSNNESPHDYEIEHANVLTRINKLDITLISGLGSILADGTNMNPYFVVDEYQGKNELYQTIEDYVNISNIRTLRPAFAFTNQFNLESDSDNIISTGTYKIKLMVQIEMLTDGVSSNHTDTVECTLIP